MHAAEMFARKIDHFIATRCCFRSDRFARLRHPLGYMPWPPFARWLTSSEMLNFLAPAGESDFQLELVGAGEILRGAIKSHEGRHVDRQTLFDIGGFEHGALDADGAVRRRPASRIPGSGPEVQSGRMLV